MAKKKDLRTPTERNADTQAALAKAGLGPNDTPPKAPKK